MGSATPFRLSPADAERYARLRLRMLLDAPWACSASPEDDKGLDLGFLEKAFASETQATFAMESPAPAAVAAPHGEHEKREFVAAAGIVRQVSPKFRRRATIRACSLSRNPAAEDPAAR